MGFGNDDYMDNLESENRRLRPEQFMPSLSEWGDSIQWCVVDMSGDVWTSVLEPKVSFVSWRPTDAYHGKAIIPLGIDWRTLKVSREQMEAYENE